MRSHTAIALLVLGVSWASLPAAQPVREHEGVASPAETPPASTSRPPVGENGSATEPVSGGSKLDSFEPSEQIPADSAVAFPTDI
jgi:hypothetical protein